MAKHLIFHLDDFRAALTEDAFRLFALLDQQRLLSEDAKHSLAQCCASALPGTIEPKAVFMLVVAECICDYLGSPEFDRVRFINHG